MTNPNEIEKPDIVNQDVFGGKKKLTTDERIATLEWKVEQLLKAVLALQEASE